MARQPTEKMFQHILAANTTVTVYSWWTHIA